MAAFPDRPADAAPVPDRLPAAAAFVGAAELAEANLYAVSAEIAHGAAHRIDPARLCL